MESNGYYKNFLAAERLAKVYALATPRVKQYLAGEIEHIAKQLQLSDIFLELGSGYGRFLKEINHKVKFAYGIDTSHASLKASQQYFKNMTNIRLAQMDAVKLAFPDHSFDIVVCIQNGMSAFHVSPRALIAESIRVTKKGGKVFFSSYSTKFWDERLKWFQIQSKAGLVGEINWEATKEGIIVCKDGFRGMTFGPDDFRTLVAPFGLPFDICEVDESSIFCEIMV
jgi:ubiquinone/menaquinone biosynthesis C-methylase UbiE